MTDLLLIAFIFLIAGVFAVPIAARLGLGSVLGYLLAGVLISPSLTVLGVDLAAVQHFAEFGVVMMLFLVGLELNPQQLWDMRRKLIGLGGLQVAVTAVVVMGIALLLGQRWQVSLAIGLILSLSSTAIVLQTLTEKGLIQSDGGKASFAVLLFQDIAVIPMLALIPLLALSDLHSSSGDDHSASLSLVDGLVGWQTALVTIAAVAFVLAIGNYLARPLLRFVASAQLRELFTGAALLLVIGIALLMTLVGLSPALGTFLAGLVLGNSEFRHELEADIQPFKALLLGLFFMTVGAGINFVLLFDEFAILLGLTLTLIVVKAAILGILAYVFRIRGSDKSLTAIALAQAGEFGFVLLSFSVSNAVLPSAIADRLMLVVALSMILTPLLFLAFEHWILPRHARPEGGMDEEIEQGDVLILGHGRVGGIVNRMMRANKFNTTVIDYSSTQLEMLQAFGIRAFFGDATRPDLLKAAGIENAKVVVVAIDGKDEITKLVHYIHKTYPKVHITARAFDRIHVYDLWYAGCRDVIRETYDSSLRLGRSAIEAMGLSRERAQFIADEFEKVDRRSMVEASELWDPNVSTLENQPYIEKVKEITHDWEEMLRGRLHPSEPKQEPNNTATNTDN